MVRWIALSLCLLLAGAQDPADRVKALVEKLKSEDLSERESAATELVKLGPAALPAVRLHFDRARGDTRDQLERILRKLELAEKVEALSAPGPKVTMAGKDLRLVDVLAHLQKSTGITIAATGLPENAVVTVDVRDVSVWKAVDEICRAHGRIMYSFGADRIIVRPGEYRRLPAFDSGPFRFVVDAFDMSRPFGDSYRKFELVGGVLAPPGRFPEFMRIVVDAFQDDDGQDLFRSADNRGISGEGHPDGRDLKPPVVFQGLTWLGGDGPGWDCKKLRAFNGHALLYFAVGRRRLVAIKNPLAVEDEECNREKSTVRILDVVRDGRRVHLRCSFQRAIREGELKGKSESWRYTAALYDSGGRRFGGLATFPSVSHSPDEGVIRWTDTIRFDLPEDFKADSFDLEEIEYLHTVRVPFNLDGATIR